jgi:hypothetical protein
MDNEGGMERLIHNSVNYLIRQNTDESWGEAIAMLMSALKNQDGLFIMPRLDDDYPEHIRLCIVLASALRMHIDAGILASVQPIECGENNG